MYVDIDKLAKEVRDEISTRKKESNDWWRNHRSWKRKHLYESDKLSVNGFPTVG